VKRIATVTRAIPRRVGFCACDAGSLICRNPPEQYVQYGWSHRRHIRLELFQITFEQLLERKCVVIKELAGTERPNRRFPMMKCRIAFLFVTGAALICVASAQNSKVGSSSAESGADPLKKAIQPLTPKSAMAPPRKSSVAAPKASTSGRDTNAELTRLEGQGIKTGGSKSGNTGASKRNLVKPTSTSSGSGSGIDFSHQKPRVNQK